MQSCSFDKKTELLLKNEIKSSSLPFLPKQDILNSKIEYIYWFKDYLINMVIFYTSHSTRKYLLCVHRKKIECISYDYTPVHYTTYNFSLSHETIEHLETFLPEIQEVSRLLYLLVLKRLFKKQNSIELFEKEEYGFLFYLQNLPVELQSKVLSFL